MKTLKSVIKTHTTACGVSVFSSKDTYLVEGLDFYSAKDALTNLSKELLGKKVVWFDLQPNGNLAIGYQA